MKKLSNSEAEMKKIVAYKKACNYINIWGFSNERETAHFLNHSVFSKFIFLLKVYQELFLAYKCSEL